MKWIFFVLLQYGEIVEPRLAEKMSQTVSCYESLDAAMVNCKWLQILELSKVIAVRVERNRYLSNNI